MSLEAVKQYFKEQDMESRVMEFQQSSATVEEAAAAIGCEPRQIAKTMSFYVDDAPILIVLAGDTKIDNKKYKAKFQQKAKMIPPGSGGNRYRSPTGWCLSFRYRTKSHGIS